MVIGLGIFGCKLPEPVSPLNPPTWIIGTWSDVTEIATWTFTSDNATWTTGQTSIDFKESQGSGVVVSDDATDTSYSVRLSANGVTQSYTFQKVDATTITWTTLGLQLLKVVPAAAVTGVTVSPASATVLVGQAVQLEAIFVPSNATDKRVLWTTSDENVAAVSATGLVVAASVGSATITVTTNDGGKTATCVVTAVSAPVPPTSPSPSNGSTTSDATPLLDWEDFFGATNYHVQVNTNSSFTGTMVCDSSSITTAQYQVSTALSNSTTYYWRVRVGVGELWSLWSSTWSFAVQVLPPDTPSPTNGITLTDATPLLDWEDVSGANGYHVQVNTNSSFTGTMVGESTSLGNSQFEVPTTLSNDTTYYWRVRVNSDGAWSQWSSTWSFTIHVAPPVSPSPPNGSTVSDGTPLLNWEDTSGASGYHVQVNTNSSFTGTMVGESNSLGNSQFEVPTTLSNDTTYYWRVRVNSGGTWSQWSNMWSFTISFVSPVVPNPPSGSTIYDTTPLLNWEDVVAADKYHVQVNANSNFTGTMIEQSDSITNSQIQITTTLSDETTYYWRVQADFGGVWGPWSSVWSFTVDSGSEINMINIDAASDSFAMGDGSYGPIPTIVQTISFNFRMSKFEITNSQFAQFIADGGYENSSYWTSNGWTKRTLGGWTEPALWTNPSYYGDNQPATGVGWYEAVAFCNWLSDKEGLSRAYDSAGNVLFTASGYRLPTEVEWEYAAAKGAANQSERVYPWGDTWDSANAVCEVAPSGDYPTADVGSKSPGGDTPQGLADMSGNVYEWCSDNWQASGSIVGNTDRYYYVGDSGSDMFVVRGGAWTCGQAPNLRCAFRDAAGTGRDNSFGFRVVRR
jgi:formylglycine-generating enzyme required for sulfatase activity